MARKKKSTKRGRIRSQMRKHFVTNTNVPICFGTRILAMISTGMTMKEVSEDLGIGRHVVSKVVQAPEMQKAAEELNGKIHGMVDKMFRSLSWAVDNETNGEMAFKLGQAIGAIKPVPKSMVVHVQPQQTIDVVPKDVEEQAAREWATRLGLMAIERNKVYGTGLPELEEDTESTKKRKLVHHGNGDKE